MKNDRMRLLSDAFRSVPLTCGGHTLRPITAGTVLLLMESGNLLFGERPGGGEATEGEAMQALFEFLWIHIGPEAEVIEDVAHPEVLRAKARKLALGIGFDDLADFSRQFGEVRQRLNAGLVDIVPDKHDEKKPGGATPRPTGLPPCCTASGDAETLSGNDGSSGGSLSSGRFSMSTLPSPQTEPGAVGRSRIWEDAEPREQEPPENVMPLP